MNPLIGEYQLLEAAKAGDLDNVRRILSGCGEIRLFFFRGHDRGLS